MKKIHLLVLALASLSATAQKKDAAYPFASSVSASDLKKHLFIVAGKDMAGRETATEGQRKAAAYIEEQFKNIGLTPGYNGNYQMPFPVYKDGNVTTELSVNETVFTNFKSFVPVTYINYSATQNFSEVVLAGHGIVDSMYNDYGDMDVTGKLVLILNGTPASYSIKDKSYYGPTSTTSKIYNAGKRGAAAVLIVNTSFPRKETNDAEQMHVELYQKTQLPNTYLVSEEVAAAIIGNRWKDIVAKSKQEAIKPELIKADVHVSYQKAITKLQSTNVLGVLEGTDLKDQYVFITAHYDHLGTHDGVIYYGADDDGSGTVSVLELAEAFAKAKAAGNGPRRTIVFMTVSGEEKGLWGSEYYSDHPVFPLDKTTVDLNIDMIGRSDPGRTKGDSTNYIYVVGDDKLSSDLKPISESVNKKYAKLELDYKFNDPADPERIYYRSDHYNFAKNGVPIIFYFDGIHPDYHKPTDTPDKINYKLLEKRVRFIFYTAWNMANRNEMLKRDMPLP